MLIANNIKCSPIFTVFITLKYQDSLLQNNRTPLLNGTVIIIEYKQWNFSIIVYNGIIV